MLESTFWRGQIFYTCTFRQPSDMELCLIASQLNRNSKEGQWLHFEQECMYSSVGQSGGCLERGIDFKVCLFSFAWVGQTLLNPLGMEFWDILVFYERISLLLIICKDFPGHIYSFLLTISRTFTHIYHAHNTSQFLKPFYYRSSHFLV